MRATLAQHTYCILPTTSPLSDATTCREVRVQPTMQATSSKTCAKGWLVGLLGCWFGLVWFGFWFGLVWLGFWLGLVWLDRVELGFKRDGKSIVAILR